MSEGGKVSFLPLGPRFGFGSKGTNNEGSKPYKQENNYVTLNYCGACCMLIDS